VASKSRKLICDVFSVRALIATCFACVLQAALGSAMAFDNGPQIVGCDYRFGKEQGTDSCLIVGSGMGQGISWVVFEVDGKRFRYSTATPKKLSLLDAAGEQKAVFMVTNTTGQCRPGGQDADIYTFANGDRVCLYW
jgi:hypothetical protein